MKNRMTGLAEFICGFATRERIRFLSVGFIIMAVACWLLSFATVKGGRTIFGTYLGADYAAYYVSGTILNDDNAEYLYDFSVQERRYHALIPAANPEESPPLVYAPFFAVFVRPLALLPYAWSYFVFSSISMGLFVAGFRLLWISNPETKNEDYVLANLTAVSFVPFLMECWLGGQASAIAFFFISLAFYFQSRDRRALGGAALAFCLFKPTFLILLLPMLLLTRQFRSLAGFLAASLTLTGVSVAEVGWTGILQYIHSLVTFSRIKVMAPEVFRVWKNVDLYSCLQMALPRWQEVRQWIFIAVVFLVFLFLCHAWWRMARRNGNSVSERLAWACALAWTPLLSPHFGIYDSSIIIAAIVITGGLEKRPTPSTCRFLQLPLCSIAVMLYITAWFSQGLAIQIGIHVYSVMLLLLGCYLLMLAEACYRSPPEAQM